MMRRLPWRGRDALSSFGQAGGRQDPGEACQAGRRNPVGGGPMGRLDRGRNGVASFDGQAAWRVRCSPSSVSRKPVGVCSMSFSRARRSKSRSRSLAGSARPLATRCRVVSSLALSATAKPRSTDPSVSPFVQWTFLSGGGKGRSLQGWRRLTGPLWIALTALDRPSQSAGTPSCTLRG